MPRVLDSSGTLELEPYHTKRDALGVAEIVGIPLRDVPRVDRDGEGRSHRDGLRALCHDSRRPAAFLAVRVEGDTGRDGSVRSGIPVQLVGNGADPAGHPRDLAVLLAKGPPNVRVPHLSRQGRREDPPLMSGEKRRGLHPIELRGLDEIIRSQGNLESVVVGIEVPEGDAERPVFVRVPALHEGGEVPISGSSGL